MKVVQKPAAANSLADFDLDDAAIAEIFKNAHSERNRLTDNAPSNARGSTFYFWIVSGLRERLLKLGRGWAQRNVNGLEVVEHAARHLRIAYVSAEGASGDEMTSSPRGPMSVKAAEKNGQLRLLPAKYFEPARTRAPHPSLLGGGFRTWFLVIEQEGNVYHSKLALPIGVDPVSGRFVTWQYEIPIADVAIDSQPKDELVERPAPDEATKPAKPKRRRRSTPAKTAPVRDLTKTGTDPKK